MAEKIIMRRALSTSAIEQTPQLSLPVAPPQVSKLDAVDPPRLSANSAILQHVRKPWAPRDEAKMALRFNRECTSILPGLYLGGETVAMNRAMLKKKGITHIVNCAYRKVAQNDSYSLEELVPNYHAKDFTYLSLPLTDAATAPAHVYFRQVGEFIAAARESHGSVLVHCKSGLSRSATLLIAYMMSHENMSLEQAWLHVVHARPTAMPNKGFQQLLAKYEKTLLSPALITL